MPHRNSHLALAVLALAAAAGCSEPVEHRALPLERADPDLARARGSLLFSRGAGPGTTLDLELEGLEPEASYVVCVNAAAAGSPTSDALGTMAIPGWPLGAFYTNPAGEREGYWDFVQLRTDANGRYRDRLQVPLPEMDYRLKLLVKLDPDRGGAPVLKSSPLLVSVGGSWRGGVAPGLVAAGLVLLLLGPWLPWWSSKPRAGPRTSAHGCTSPGAGETSSRASAPERPRSLVDRARAEGVLLHHPEYSWIELHGRRKSFLPRQATVFRILCEHDPEAVGLPQEHIIKEWEAIHHAKRTNPVRVRDIFRSSSDEPGDFLVRVPGPASVYRLRLEPADRA